MSDSEGALVHHANEQKEMGHAARALEGAVDFNYALYIIESYCKRTKTQVSNSRPSE